MHDLYIEKEYWIGVEAAAAAQLTPRERADRLSRDNVVKYLKEWPGYG